MVQRAHGRHWRLERRGRSRVATRAAVGLLVALGLLAGSLEIHHHNGALDASADGTVVFQAAAHPTRGHHLEAQGPGLVFHCPACLLHHHSRGDAAQSVATLGAPPATGSSLALGEPTWPAPATHPGGCRAPPRG